MDRIARQTRSHFLDVFEADEDGTSTIEFVVLLPICIMFLMLVTNTNLLSLRHHTLVGVSRDTVRIVSGPALTPPEAEIYSDFDTTGAAPPVNVDPSAVSGLFAVVVAAHATSASSIGVMVPGEDQSSVVPVASPVETSR